MTAIYRFERFALDPANRRLTEAGRTVEVPGRYLDALILLVTEHGQLVTKARFLDEVWKGVPVTDEALTQCVRSLRKALHEKAGRARFIQTVPRYGYRFVAPVECGDPPPAEPPIGPIEQEPAAAVLPGPFERLTVMGRAGLIGGGIAGLIGGLVYGLAGVADGTGGAVSGLLVLAGLMSVVGMLGGAGVGFGVGSAALISQRPFPWLLIGGAAGGLLVGAGVRLVGRDAFSLLFGSVPQSMTGASEGLWLGAAIGAGVWFAQGRQRRVALLVGALLTGAAGAAAALSGGRLMGGSLAARADQFPDASLNLQALSGLVGEKTFGLVSQLMTATLEGALFGAAMVLALTLQQSAPSQKA